MQRRFELAGLHRDGIFGVARDVPARIVTGVREKCACARDIFFRLDGVDLELSFVSLVGNSQKADAVDGGVGRAKPGNSEARMVPSEVNRIEDKKEECERRDYAENQAGAGRRMIGRVRHGIGLRRYFASGEDLEEERIAGDWTQAGGLEGEGRRPSRFTLPT
jgi:hypothetical protein